jgi:putative ABC transport system permease protein
MFRNYLAAALRNLVRNRLYSVINITGLALGFTAALLIALFVRDEFSYDHFFPDYQHIYLVGSETSLPGRAGETPDATPADIAPLLKADFPSISAIARIGPDDLLVRQARSRTPSTSFGRTRRFSISLSSRPLPATSGAPWRSPTAS